MGDGAVTKSTASRGIAIGQGAITGATADMGADLGSDTATNQGGVDSISIGTLSNARGNDAIAIGHNAEVQNVPIDGSGTVASKEVSPSAAMPKYMEQATPSPLVQVPPLQQITSMEIQQMKPLRLAITQR